MGELSLALNASAPPPIRVPRVSFEALPRASGWAVITCEGLDLRLREAYADVAFGEAA